MSIGHTYMHGGDYPPPNIPQVPSDFDHHLQPRTVPQTTPPPAVVDQPMVVDPVIPAEVGSQPYPAISHSALASTSNTTAVSNESAERVRASLESIYSEEGFADNERHDHGDQLDQEPEEDHSYWDDFEDHELMYYDDMFGFNDED